MRLDLIRICCFESLPIPGRDFAVGYVEYELFYRFGADIAVERENLPYSRVRKRQALWSLSWQPRARHQVGVFIGVDGDEYEIFLQAFCEWRDSSNVIVELLVLRGKKVYH